MMLPEKPAAPREHLLWMGGNLFKRLTPTDLQRGGFKLIRREGRRYLYVRTKRNLAREKVKAARRASVRRMHRERRR